MNTTQITLLARLDNRQDSSAWREFDQLYRPMLYRFAHACGVTGTAADDLVQDCMAAVVQHIGGFEPASGSFPRASFRGWLRRIVVNRVLNCRRAQREI